MGLRWALPINHAVVMLLSTAFLCGCAVGPDFKRPEPPSAKGYSPDPIAGKTTSFPVRDGRAQHFDPEKDVPFDWWSLFKSPQINSLIDKAFKSNPTIDSAQAALKAAQENVIAQEGFFYPTIGFAYSPSRNKLAGNMGGNSPGVQGNGTVIQTYSNPPPGSPPYNAPVYYNFHTAQLTVGFTPDVFGLNKRQTESLQAQAEAQRFQLEATYVTLASNVVAAALQEASLRSQIDAVRKMISINEDLLKILQGQFKYGFVTGIDVAVQESSLAQAKQALVPLEKQLEQTRDLIRALVGNPPNEDVSETFDLASIHLPQELPLSLPSRLVEQRPDVRMAEAELHSAAAQVGVAVASRLPQFDITGMIGGMASVPSQMFRSGGGFFNLIGNVGQTIFDGGTLSARERAADQNLIQAQGQYRGTVITALQNVADTLHAIKSDADALKFSAENEQSAQKALDITRKQYEAGYVSYQVLLAADLNEQQAIIGLAQAQVARLGDTAALYQALGGGWWNRHDDTKGMAAR